MVNGMTDSELTRFSAVAHNHDMSEAPDSVNEIIVRFAKRLQTI